MEFRCEYAYGKFVFVEDVRGFEITLRNWQAIAYFSLKIYSTNQVPCMLHLKAFDTLLEQSNFEAHESHSLLQRRTDE